MLVNVEWGSHADLLHERRALYLIAHPRRWEPIYIGKADGTSVRERQVASDKLRMFRDLERQRGVYEHRLLVGLIDTAHRLTRELMADVESLLIMGLQPWGNIHSTRTRIARPGLRVRNHGIWHWSGTFIDGG